ncbi:MAG: hypothetical protein IPK79_11095 [Vampirovibrionales bacterium]|nr:hypothetical protein [Vampirovibrionales bacterium]
MITSVGFVSGNRQSFPVASVRKSASAVLFGQGDRVLGDYLRLIDPLPPPEIRIPSLKSQITRRTRTVEDFLRIKGNKVEGTIELDGTPFNFSAHTLKNDQKVPTNIFIIGPSSGRGGEKLKILDFQDGNKIVTLSRPGSNHVESLGRRQEAALDLRNRIIESCIPQQNGVLSEILSWLPRF